MDKLIEKLTPSKLCQFVPFAKDLAAINGKTNLFIQYLRSTSG